MSATASATVTAKVGPAVQLTAGVFTNVSNLNFDVSRQVLTFVTNNVLREFDLGAATTLTITIAAAAVNWTVTLS